MNIDTLGKLELHELLKDLKLLQKLEKDLGKRGKVAFDQLKEGKNIFIVEYFSGISEEEAMAQAFPVFEKSFGDKLGKWDLILKKNENLKWGIRVLKNDQMVDLSFAKIEQQIQSN